MSITFTPEDVVAAYERHPEIQPIYGGFFHRAADGGNICCCPLTMMAIETCDTARAEAMGDEEDAAEAVRQCFGATDTEINAFWLGFDQGISPWGYESIAFQELRDAHPDAGLQQLHLLGQACRQAAEEALNVRNVGDVLQEEGQDSELGDA